eukprot:gene18976-20883_t
MLHTQLIAGHEQVPSGYAEMPKRSANAPMAYKSRIPCLIESPHVQRLKELKQRVGQTVQMGEHRAQNLDYKSHMDKCDNWLQQSRDISFPTASTLNEVKLDREEKHYAKEEELRRLKDEMKLEKNLKEDARRGQDSLKQELDALKSEHYSLKKMFRKKQEEVMLLMRTDEIKPNQGVYFKKVKEDLAKSRSKNEELEMSHHQVTRQMQRLQNEVEVVRTESKRNEKIRRDDVERLLKEKEYMKLDYFSLQARMRELEDEYNRLASGVLDRKIRNVTYIKEVEETRDTNEMETLKIKIHDLEKSNHQLATEELGKLKKQCISLESDKERLLMKIDQQIDSKASMGNRIAVLVKEKEQIKASFGDRVSSNEATELKATLDELVKENMSLLEKIQQQDEETSLMKKKLEYFKTELKKKIEKSRIMKKEGLEQGELLKMQRMQIERLEEQVTKFEKAKKDSKVISERCEEIKEFKTKIEDLQNKIELITWKNENLEKELQTKEIILTEVKKEQHGSKALKEENECLNNKITQLQEELQTCNEDWQEKIARLEQELQAGKKMDKQLKKESFQLKKIQEEYEIAKHDLEIKNKDLQMKNEDLNALQKKCDQLKTELGVFEKDKTDMQANCDVVKKTLKAKEAGHKEMEAKAKKEKEMLKGKIKRLQEAVKQKGVQEDRLQKENDRLQNEKERDANITVKLKEDIDELNKSIDSMKIHERKIQSHSYELKKKLDKEEELNKDLSKKCKKLELEAKKKSEESSEKNNKESKKLKEKLQAMSVEIEEYKAKVKAYELEIQENKNKNTMQQCKNKKPKDQVNEECYESDFESEVDEEIEIIEDVEEAEGNEDDNEECPVMILTNENKEESKEEESKVNVDQEYYESDFESDDDVEEASQKSSDRSLDNEARSEARSDNKSETRSEVGEEIDEEIEEIEEVGDDEDECPMVIITKGNMQDGSVSFNDDKDDIWDIFEKKKQNRGKEDFKVKEAKEEEKADEASQESSFNVQRRGGKLKSALEYADNTNKPEIRKSKENYLPSAIARYIYVGDERKQSDDDYLSLSDSEYFGTGLFVLSAYSNADFKSSNALRATLGIRLPGDNHTDEKKSKQKKNKTNTKKKTNKSIVVAESDSSDSDNSSCGGLTRQPSGLFESTPFVTRSPFRGMPVLPRRDTNKSGLPQLR